MKHLLKLLLLMVCLPAFGTTYYVDYAGRADNSGDGLSWATAFKVITNTVSFVSGDVIRIAKSPDATSMAQNATWTSGSLTVTLTTAVTAKIDYCETNWVPSANVTSTLNNSRKEGANCEQSTIADAFTTGLAAYHPITAATDFSGYQQVSFWVKASTAVATNSISLRLCSDGVGATSVQTIKIPPIPFQNIWQLVKVDTGGALPASVSSIALYIDSDFGATDIYFDDIIASKASSSADSLTLASLIGKNTAAEPEWYPIKYINGTTVVLDNDPQQTVAAGRGYYAPGGQTETVTTWKREPIQMNAPAASSTIIHQIPTSAAGDVVTGKILYSGGWNTSNSTQGITIWDACNGFGKIVSLNGRTNVAFENLWLIRGNTGFDGATVTGNNDNTFTNCAGIACAVNGFTISTSYRCQLVNCYALNNAGAGETFQSGGKHAIYGNTINNNLASAAVGHTTSGCLFKNCKLSNQTGPGLDLATPLTTVIGCIVEGNSTYGVRFNSEAVGTEVFNTRTSNNVSGSYQFQQINQYEQYLYNCLMYDSPYFTWNANFQSYLLPMTAYVDQHMNTVTNSRQYTATHMWYQDITNSRPGGASSASWAIKGSNVFISAEIPASLKLQPFVFSTLNATGTVSVYVCRSSSNSVTTLRIPAYSIGNTNDLTATSTATTNTWDLLSVAYTNTLGTNLIRTIYVDTYGDTAGNPVWITDPAHNGTNYDINTSFRAQPVLRPPTSAGGTTVNGGSWTF